MGKLLFIPAFILCYLFSLLAMADEFRPGFLSIIEQSENQFAVMFKVPMKGNYRLHLVPRLPGNCVINSPKYRNENGSAATSRWAIQCQGSLHGRNIAIEGLKDTATQVLMRIEFSDGSLVSAKFTPTRDTITITQKTGVATIANTYTLLGIEHILKGWDHLLFVTCLLIICGLGFSDLNRIMITVTGFTLAHSVTLIATTLQWIKVPVAPVEAIIALSILFLASEALKRNRRSKTSRHLFPTVLYRTHPCVSLLPRHMTDMDVGNVDCAGAHNRPVHPEHNTLTWRYPILVSSSFGLIHGFGFATVLQDIGLPQNNLATALISFNIGIEIGQLVFIFSLMLVTQLCLLFKFDQYRYIASIPLYLIGGISAFWFIERVNNIL